MFVFFPCFLPTQILLPTQTAMLKPTPIAQSDRPQCVDSSSHGIVRSIGHAKRARARYYRTHTPIPPYVAIDWCGHECTNEACWHTFTHVVVVFVRPPSTLYARRRAVAPSRAPSRRHAVARDATHHVFAASRARSDDAHAPRLSKRRERLVAVAASF